MESNISRIRFFSLLKPDLKYFIGFFKIKSVESSGFRWIDHKITFGKAFADILANS